MEILGFSSHQESKKSLRDFVVSFIHRVSYFMSDINNNGDEEDILKKYNAEFFPNAGKHPIIDIAFTSLQGKNIVIQKSGELYTKDGIIQQFLNGEIIFSIEKVENSEPAPSYKEPDKLRYIKSVHFKKRDVNGIESDYFCTQDNFSKLIRGVLIAKSFISINFQK